MSDGPEQLLGGAAEVWRGDCLSPEHVATVMGERKADALIFDAPYSEKVHAGHDSQVRHLKESFGRVAIGARPTPEQSYAAGPNPMRRAIDYAAWRDGEVASFCALWLPRCRGWFVTITDHLLARAWEGSLVAAGLYVFPPLPLVETGSRVRMAGDGPSGWTCWVVVARPRSKEWASWGTLPGAYVVPGERKMNSADGSSRVVGGKPLLAMQCIVDDYSRRGDLVVDPTCGGGTTGRAALALGRHFIGIEKDHGRAQLSAATCKSVNINQGDLFT